MRAHAPKRIQTFSGCQVSGARRHVVNRGVVLCHVVAFIMRARHPIVPKLKLLDAITQPVETHVHGFRPPRVNGVIDHAQCRRVVGLDGRWGLWVAHLDESMPGRDCCTIIDVEGAELGIGRGGHDGFGDLSNGEDGPVVWWVGRIV